MAKSSDGRWPTAVDLFSGAGGLSLGLRQARFRIVGAVDDDALCADTYADNFPGVPLLRKDVREVSAEDLLGAGNLKVGELDLLAGCPPCQGFSTIRTRNGASCVADDRNDLVLEFSRLVKELQPRAVLMENVPRLAEDERFEKYVRMVRRAGYGVRWAVLDAADFGVPQRRRRLIAVAYRGDRPELARGSSERTTVRDAISALPPAGSSGDAAHDHGESRSAKVARLIARVSSDGGSRGDLPEESQLECHRRTDGFHDVYGRMSWDEPAPTITSGCVNPSKGRFLHPTANRSITLREAALLQGFPRDYVWRMDRGKYAAASMIGNALPPQFVKGQVAEIRDHLTA